MRIIKKTSRLMTNVTAYRLWQAPFARAKMAPVLQYNDLRAVRRVLDVGCGPGTNCAYFAHADYLGIDLNHDYIEYARRRYRREFVVQDVRDYRPPEGQPFDFVLMNSLLHHLSDEDTHQALRRLRPLVCSDGHVHVIELVMPERACVARLLAAGDRGDYARPLGRWNEILSEHFCPVVFVPYPVKAFGITLWNLVYFKGRGEH